MEGQAAGDLGRRTGRETGHREEAASIFSALVQDGVIRWDGVFLGRNI
jgi:hypothetical protein